MFWLYAALILVALIIYYFKGVYSYWRDRGVLTPKYSYLFGTLGDTITFKRSYGEVINDIYNEYKGYNYVGYYKFMQPGVIIRNPEIIKDVLLTNFSHFRDNDLDIDEKNDKIFGKNPFVLKGDKWKTVRGQITPCFSGSKLKAMMPLLQNNAKKLVKFLNEEPNAESTEGLEAKQISLKYTCENVASCAFGLEGKAFEDPNTDFQKYGDKILQPSTWMGVKILLISILPKLTTFLKIKFVTDDVEQFYKSIVHQALDYRKSQKVYRNDFLDFMSDLRAKINDEKQFNADDIVAHAAGFFGDGYETSSVAISFIIYELAANQEVQEKVRKEVEITLKKHGGEFTYEAMQEMTYLECAIKESLRLNVPVSALSRRCTEPFKLPPMMEDNTGPTAVVEKGMPVVFPVEGLHMDPKLFPDPQRFDPDRFADDSEVAKGTYLPFGDGPRMCLGVKFGMLQTKLGVAAIVNSFEIKPNGKTLEPLQFDRRTFIRVPIGGLWVNFYKINKN